jgi:cell wall-associated NlpC family hydrolase
MNDAGGVLTGAPRNQHNNAWAWSNAGIAKWLDGVAAVARGLHGRAAVTAIASRYERPANIPAEIADAMAHYGKVGMGRGATAAGGQTVQVHSGLQFDQAQFKAQSGMLLLHAAVQQQQGDPMAQQNLLSGLSAARKAATARVVGGNGGANAGMPVAGAKGGIGGRVAAIAARQVGTPYVWGGESKSGFDCSGLVQFAYAKLGIKLPRVAADQGKAGRAVSYKNLKPGDLLVEGNGDHVVMFGGMHNGVPSVIQAPHTGTNVQWSPLTWFPPSQYNARRIVG